MAAKGNRTTRAFGTCSGTSIPIVERFVRRVFIARAFGELKPTLPCWGSSSQFFGRLRYAARRLVTGRRPLHLTSIRGKVHVASYRAVGSTVKR